MEAFEPLCRWLERLEVAVELVRKWEELAERPFTNSFKMRKLEERLGQHMIEIVGAGDKARNGR
jgi:hypothetical protein